MNIDKHYIICLCTLALLPFMYVQQVLAVNIPFTLGWNKNTEPDMKIKGEYNIYIGKSPDDLKLRTSVKHRDYEKEEIVKYIMHEYVGDRHNKIRLEKGETYYLALSASDSNGNESEKTSPPISVQIEEILVTTTTTTYSPTTTIKPDESSPTGTIIINKGNEITPSQFVTLFLSAADDESGMGQGAKMSFSNDNQVWTTPEPFHPTKEWILTPGDGIKTVYAKFCDNAGNWMNESVSDSIGLQLTCPKPLQLGATAIASSGVPLTVCSEDKTVDGKTGTGWLSPLRSTPQDEYITLDLGESRIINRIDLCSNTFFLLNLFPRDFKIQGSLDNKQWIDLFSETDYSPPLSHTDSWSFDNTEIRYLQLVATKTRQFLFFFYATYIAEIKVFGCTEPEVQTPEVLTTGTLNQTEAGVEKETPVKQEKEKRLLQPTTSNPGRPGRPVFLLNGNP